VTGVRPPRLRDVFNFSGSEIFFLLLIALVVLGPEKLPDAVRKFGKTYAEFKKVTSGFQSEFRQVLDEPMREMRETADAFRKAATFDLDQTPGAGGEASHDVMSTQTPASVVRDPDAADAPPVVAIDGEPVAPSSAEAAPDGDEPEARTA
jgi:sec-independent protein translocase protein TatB